GFFQLKGGRRVSIQKPNTSYLTYYAHYNTNIWCTNNTAIPADLRLYTTSTTPILDDCTVAFSVCTAQSTATTPGTNAVTLEALAFVVLPGNPNTDVYNDQLPDDRHSMVFGVGRVTGSPQTLDDGHGSRVINVAVSDYVR
ncbi:hypothetical protein B0H13DRAFT_1571758, partial [Mycena leptocephala]